MPKAVCIHTATLQQMSGERIGVVCAFTAGPVQGLPGIMLLIAHIADVCHGGQGIREIVQYSRGYGLHLTLRSVIR